MCTEPPFINVMRKKAITIQSENRRYAVIIRLRRYLSVFKFKHTDVEDVEASNKQIFESIYWKLFN